MPSGKYRAWRKSKPENYISGETAVKESGQPCPEQQHPGFLVVMIKKKELQETR